MPLRNTHMKVAPFPGVSLGGGIARDAGVGLVLDGNVLNADMSQWLYAPAWIPGNNPPTETTVTLGTFNAAAGSDTEVTIKSKEYQDKDATSRINLWTVAPDNWVDTQCRYRVIIRVNDASAGGNLVYGLAIRSYADQNLIAQIRTRQTLTHTLPGTTLLQNDTCLISSFSSWFTPAGTTADKAPLYLDFTLVSATASGSPDYFYLIGVHLEFK